MVRLNICGSGAGIYTTMSLKRLVVKSELAVAICHSRKDFDEDWY